MKSLYRLARPSDGRISRHPPSSFLSHSFTSRTSIRHRLNIFLLRNKRGCAVLTSLGPKPKPRHKEHTYCGHPNRHLKSPGVLQHRMGHALGRRIDRAVYGRSNAHPDRCTQTVEGVLYAGCQTLLVCWEALHHIHLQRH